MEGEKNTKFLHHTIKANQFKSLTHKICIYEDQQIERSDNIGKAIVDFFSTILTSVPHENQESIYTSIPKLVSFSDNDSVIVLSYMEDLKNIVFEWILMVLLVQMISLDFLY